MKKNEEVCVALGLSSLAAGLKQQTATTNTKKAKMMSIFRKMRARTIVLKHRRYIKIRYFWLVICYMPIKTVKLIIFQLRMNYRESNLLRQIQPRIN